MSSCDLVAALRGAVAAGDRPSAPEADLTGAVLAGADLRGADLRGADLRGADLRRADLRGADLREADLREADLRGADLRRANLAEADLCRADLRRANLDEADLRGANLRRANLAEADLAGVLSCGGILSVQGIPSGHAILTVTPQGWHLRVGCWSGTVADLRALIASDTGWPEARGDEIIRRRPILTALADLCDAHIAGHQATLDLAIATWSGAAS